MWFKPIIGSVRLLLQFLAVGLLGVFVTAVAVFVYVLESRPDLSIWHLADLDEEFTTKSNVSNFRDYLALEDRLFAQLDTLVYPNVPQGPENAFNRYSRGSMSDPERWPVNWNRSFEMRQEEPKAGVLLLHGLSDSPYSMRALGQLLHEHGAWVVGLRIPGHGTAPSGLVETTWQDMAAAVRLAARHVANVAGDKPFYVVGYSNGGALSVEYALSTLDNPSLNRPSGIILLSPEIGVAGMAALAVWQGRLGHLLGLEKLAWNALLPEYDPFKYGSFAINAGDLAHRITVHIQEQLNSLQGSGKLEQLPPILAFQSSVDATVTASALVANLFARLPPANHELVLFDINRNVETATLLKHDPRTVFRPLLDTPERGYDLTVVTNGSPGTNDAIAKTMAHGKQDFSAPISLGEWPAGIYSLSHVALPFSPQDPVYGGPSAGKSAGVQLGNLALRGERGVLQVSGTALLRLRWNPFFDYIALRTLRFTGLGDE